MADDRVAYYELRKKRALETIDQIENRGWTFHEADGDQVLRDVTAERLAAKRAEILKMDEFIAMSKRVPGRSGPLDIPNHAIARRRSILAADLPCGPRDRSQ